MYDITTCKELLKLCHEPFVTRRYNIICLLKLVVKAAIIPSEKIEMDTHNCIMQG